MVQGFMPGWGGRGESGQMRDFSLVSVGFCADSMRFLQKYVKNEGPEAPKSTPEAPKSTPEAPKSTPDHPRREHFQKSSEMFSLFQKSLEIVQSFSAKRAISGSKMEAFSPEIAPKGGPGAKTAIFLQKC